MARAFCLVAMWMVLSASTVWGELQDRQQVQQVADAFLSGLPAGEYHILADQLLERLNAGRQDFIIVDVRSPKERTYDQGHIPGARYVALRDAAKPQTLATLPRDKDIIVYCGTGHEENKVLTVWRMLGYRAYALRWGYTSWKTGGATANTLKALEGAILNNYPVEK